MIRIVASPETPTPSSSSMADLTLLVKRGSQNPRPDDLLPEYNGGIIRWVPPDPGWLRNYQKFPDGKRQMHAPRHKSDSEFASSNWRRCVSCVAMILALSLSGCSVGGQADSQPLPTSTAAPATPDSASVSNQTPCSDGKLRIRDLSQIDGAWQEPLGQATKLARQWQNDSILIQMRVACQLFEPGFRIQAIFFSDQAQSIYSPDTDESEPRELDEGEVMPTLDVSVVSFADLRQELLDADYSDDAELLPSTGVDVQINSLVAPFGPDSVPQGATLSHVSIKRFGEVQDLFIEPSTGDIYRYASPGG